MIRKGRVIAGKQTMQKALAVTRRIIAKKQAKHENVAKKAKPTSRDPEAYETNGIISFEQFAGWQITSPSDQVESTLQQAAERLAAFE